MSEMVQVTEADYINQLIKFIRPFKIQKLLSRQKRGDRPPKRKANA